VLVFNQRKLPILPWVKAVQRLQATGIIVEENCEKK
jgi:hypothetical protein